MKKYYLIIIIAIVFCIYGCEKTEISLNKEGDPASITGTWVTDNYIEKTYYLANPITPAGDITYRDTTVVDSTTLTFVFGAGRIDSVQVTAVKTLNGVQQAPVPLANTPWSFTLGTSTGDEKTGLNYLLIYQPRTPGNGVPSGSYGTSYTYNMLSATQMNIKWVVTNSTSYNTLQYKAILNKQ